MKGSQETNAGFRWSPWLKTLPLFWCPANVVLRAISRKAKEETREGVFTSSASSTPHLLPSLPPPPPPPLLGWFSPSSSLSLSSPCCCRPQQREEEEETEESREEGVLMEAQVLTAVAVDRDKNSQFAVKWAVEHLLVCNHSILLLHVRHKSNNGFGTSEFNSNTAESEQIFLPYRTFCARKGVQTDEILLEEADVAKGLANYIATHHIHNMVVGSSSRNVITRKFRPPDVASILAKIAPEFCAIYVITKGKAITVRSAKGPAPPYALPPAAPGITHHAPNHDHNESVKKQIKRGNGRSPSPSNLHERRSAEKHAAPRHHHQHDTHQHHNHHDNPQHDHHHDIAQRSSRPGSRESFPDGGETSGGNDMPDVTYISEESVPGLHKDMEAEMKRLRLELKQTMDMYSSACKEAITAKQTAKELHQWKVEEARKFEEVRQSEEAALALAEFEKAKCKAAMEAAQAAQRLAELEAKKRQDAEMKAKREAEEKQKALDALAQNDVRYRKYGIEEIEMATGYFAESQMIGEGGYGQVYRACLNHTPVAIKVLRPDAAQGRKQFHQEVEVLSCIRHPNMVLLLGACPEYGCLVYEYMDNGSLEDRIFRRGNTPSIPWPVRFRIAAEIATALLFLHQTKPEPLVHRDLKPANILLDRNYVSKISDVGLARLVPPSVADSVTQYRLTSTAGTFCYIDPEYQQTGMLGIKSDIYSLGVMLLQIITAKPPMGLTHIVERALNKGNFEEMLDPTVSDWPMEDTLGYATLALKCSELRKKDRPDLATVILPELNRLRNLGHVYEAKQSGRQSGVDQEVSQR